MFQFMLNTIKIVFFVVLGQLFFSSLCGVFVCAHFV